MASKNGNKLVAHLEFSKREVRYDWHMPKNTHCFGVFCVKSRWKFQAVNFSGRWQVSTWLEVPNPHRILSSLTHSLRSDIFLPSHSVVLACNLHNARYIVAFPFFCYGFYYHGGHEANTRIWSGEWYLFQRINLFHHSSRPNTHWNGNIKSNLDMNQGKLVEFHELSPDRASPRVRINALGNPDTVSGKKGLSSRKIQPLRPRS